MPLWERVNKKRLEAKKEQARRLLEGKDVEKNETKAVKLLEDCVALGDPDSMLTLAKCYAFGKGVKRNAERAEDLITQSAMNGNTEARPLSNVLREWKRNQAIDCNSLLGFFRVSFYLDLPPRHCFPSGTLQQLLTVEQLVFVMNAIPCQILGCLFLDRKTNKNKRVFFQCLWFFLETDKVEPVSDGIIAEPFWKQLETYTTLAELELWGECITERLYQSNNSLLFFHCTKHQNNPVERKKQNNCLKC